MTSDRNIGYDPATPPEAEAALYCDYCGEPIFEGERYCKLSGEIVCEHCIGDLYEIA